jgi:hypothetical protein
MEQQQADALALLAETALHHGIDPGAPAERYQVVVHVDAEVLADPDAPGQSALEDGARVPAGTSQRLACAASRVVMRHGPDGQVVEVGARTRTIPSALRRVAAAREIPGDPMQTLRARHEAGGLRLHARTAMPGWLGERLDVGYAIDVLHPLAR